jgi:hypothetical protein
MSLDVTLRDATGRRDDGRIAEALRLADATVIRMHDGRTATLPTLGAALAYACDPATRKAWDGGEQQAAEWERARREVLGILPEDLEVSALTGNHLVLVAKSAFARAAVGARRGLRCDLDEWGAALATARMHTYDPSNPDVLQQVLSVVVGVLGTPACEATDAASGARPTVKPAWAIRTADLLRAMLRHTGVRRGGPFQCLANLSVPGNLEPELKKCAEQFGVSLNSKIDRPRHTEAVARAALRMLEDPRHMMYGLLAPLANGRAVFDVRRSEVRLNDDGSAEVFCQNRRFCAHRKAWHPLDADAAAVMHVLIGGPYASALTDAGRARRDVRLLADVAWDGQALRLTDEATEGRTEDDGLLDPRARLLFALGIEGRGGQVARMWRSHLTIEETTGESLGEVPGAGTKGGRHVLWCAAQRRILYFAQRVGHLADLERAYREGVIRDYPLFPQGKLRLGRVPLRGDAPPEPVNERTLNDWVHELEALVGAPQLEHGGLNAFRRIFVDVYNRWERSGRVKDLIVGHEDVRDPEQSSTRGRVYLDPRDLRLLARAQALMEHARTTWAVSGRDFVPQPAPDQDDTQAIDDDG